MTQLLVPGLAFGQIVSAPVLRRVRQSLDPATLPGAVLILDPSKGVFIDSAGTTPAQTGDFIRLWRDQSNAGNHASARGDNERPQLVTVLADPNGNAWMDIAGAQGMITNGNLTKPYSIYVVERAYGLIGEARTVQSCDINALINTRRNNGNNVYLNGLIHQAASTSALDVSCLQVTSAGSTYTLNGVDKTDYSGPNADWGRVALGCAGSTYESGNTRIGYVACFSSVLSPANHSALMNYFASRFGTGS